jgi:hypothetical protein
MRSRLARLGDAMLAHVLPTAEAGACIVGTGSDCKCGSPCGVNWCTQYRISCYGQCVEDSGDHC